MCVYIHVYVCVCDVSMATPDETEIYGAPVDLLTRGLRKSSIEFGRFGGVLIAD